MRLIDADALEGEMLKELLANAVAMRRRTKYTVGEVRTMLNRQPTIDASPVVRGEWAYDVAKGHYCTNCGWEMSTYCQIPTYQHNYCPSCGAKMKGGEG